jgi:RNA recognition motif-containing protein
MKLYVGNLPLSISDTDLEDLFSPFGVVTSARVITSRHTGRSRGFGFVEMLRECGQIAISSLNGKQIGSMVLRVNEARELPDKRSSGLH